MPTSPQGTWRFALSGFGVAVAALLLVLTLGGGAPQPAPAGLPDPGPVVGWGISIAKLAVDLGAASTIGFLLLAVFLLPSSGRDVEGLAAQAVPVARISAWVWSLGAVAFYFCEAAEFAGVPLRGLDLTSVWSPIADTALGRLMAAQALLALTVAYALRWTIAVRWLGVWLGVALAALGAEALTGHSAASGAHDLAMATLLVHLVAVSLWVGGLLALGWVAWHGSKRFGAAVGRYSALALWLFVAVGLSGSVNAAIRFADVSQVWTTDYGLVVLAKSTAFVVLGVLGWFQRRHVVAAGTGFARLAVAELTIMAATMGIAVGLGRTPSPKGDYLLTPAQDLLGGPVPPAPTIERLLTGFAPSGVGLTIVILGAALYVRGLMVMRKRGDAWPIGRTFAWFTGLAVVGWSTFGGLGLYSHVMFSTHMVSHMMLSMVAPIFLVLGAPVTLAIRTLPGPRQTGEVSPRALLISLVHSPVARFLTFPVVPPLIFVGSLYALYFTPLFDWSMRGIYGHGLMELHFLATGSLFYYVLVGIDPSPRAIPPIGRFGILLVTIPFHAFFAIAVMSSKTVFADTYWRILHRPYATDLLRDQYVGGSIAWALGELPLILVMLALFAQWIRSDARDAKRLDRAADRDDDAALKAYNEQLAALHKKSRQP